MSDSGQRRVIIYVAKRGVWGIMERREEPYVDVDLEAYGNYLGGVP